MLQILFDRCRSCLIALLALLAAACVELDVPNHLLPVPGALKSQMQAKGMDLRSPIFIRIFKEESVLEVWKQRAGGKFGLLKSYDICKWSGKLGPKFKEGDRQAPEGFYTVNKWQMNPRSEYFLSFNLGFPNKLDQAYGRTGSHLMVHGSCSSRGCYAMQDHQIGEIYALAREAFSGGQKSFLVHAMPFRMTPVNMARHHKSAHFAFWQNLKQGEDHFEITKVPPRVDVCGRQYVFNSRAVDGTRLKASQRCPILTMDTGLQRALASRAARDEAEFDRVLPDIKARQAHVRETEQQKMAAKKSEGSRAQAGNDGSVLLVAKHPRPRPSTETKPAVSENKNGLFQWLGTIHNPFASEQGEKETAGDVSGLTIEMQETRTTRAISDAQSTDRLLRIGQYINSATIFAERWPKLPR